MVFEFNDAKVLFGMFQGFKKATPYEGARKLRLTLPPVCRGRDVDVEVKYGLGRKKI